MDYYIDKFKKKKCIKKKYNFKPFITRILLSIIFFLVSIIIINKDNEYKSIYIDKVFSESLKFTKIKSLYESIFGSILPSGSQEVFSSSLVYEDISSYYDGEKLTFSSTTLINSLASGVVVYIGNKDNYKNTVIIQGIDGVDIWYGNLDNVAVSLYDYIETNTLLGDTQELYLVIKKDNEYIKYEDYQS